MGIETIIVDHEGIKRDEGIYCERCGRELKRRLHRLTSYDPMTGQKVNDGNLLELSCPSWWCRMKYEGRGDI